MEAKQVEMVDLLVNDMGMNIVHLGERFFAGTIEIPDATQKHCTVIGKELSHFFKTNSITKTAEQLKIDVNTFMNNITPMTIKFNVNTEWYSYSK